MSRYLLIQQALLPCLLRNATLSCCSIMQEAYLLEQKICQDRKQPYAKKNTSAFREN